MPAAAAMCRRHRCLRRRQSGHEPVPWLAKACNPVVDRPASDRLVCKLNQAAPCILAGRRKQAPGQLLVPVGGLQGGVLLGNAGCIDKDGCGGKGWGSRVLQPFLVNSAPPSASGSPPFAEHRGSGGLRPEGHDYKEEEERLHELEEHQVG